MAVRGLPATVGVRMVVPGAGLVDEAQPLLGTAATGVAAVVAVVLPGLGVVLVGSEVVVDDVLDPPHAVATTPTARITTHHHPPRRLPAPDLTSL